MKVTYHTHQTSGRISVNRHGSCPLLHGCHGYLACCRSPWWQAGGLSIGWEQLWAQRIIRQCEGLGRATKHMHTKVMLDFGKWPYRRGEVRKKGWWWRKIRWERGGGGKEREAKRRRWKGDTEEVKKRSEFIFFKKKKRKTGYIKMEGKRQSLLLVIRSKVKAWQRKRCLDVHIFHQKVCPLKGQLAAINVHIMSVLNIKEHQQRNPPVYLLLS